MPATNTTSFNRYSSNIAEDGAIAIFDLLPDASVDFGAPGSDDPRPAGADFLSSAYKFFEIPSSHCAKKSMGYYVNNRTTQYTEFPSVAGIPMNYGGSPRARYKALSDDINGSEPFLLLPSFGMTHDYIDRAKTLEMWLNLEPYAQASVNNLLTDPIAELTWDDGLVGGGYIGGPLTLVTDATKYESSNPLNNTLLAGADTTITFMDKARLSGIQTYIFNMAINGAIGSTVTPRFSFLIDGKATVYEFPLTTTLDNEWEVVEVEFSVDETVVVGEAALNIYFPDTMKISSLSLVAKTSDVVETLATEQPLIQFGGINGTRVKITADADFMYLYGYGKSANFQVGEWARPIYLVMVDNDKTFDVYVDCALAMSITKDSVVETYGNVTGEWVLMYLSESFKYMDVSTISFYNAAMGEDIQRIHNLFGYGPKYNDVITQSAHDKAYVADGSATTFASQILFPQTTSFNIGTSFGIDNSNRLELPDYGLPKLINGDYANINIFGHGDIDGYGPRIFTFPQDSEAVIDPRDIANDPEYLMIMVSPYARHLNLLTENQASANTDLTGFTGVNSTIARVGSSTPGITAVQATATGTVGSGIFQDGSPTAGTMPVVPGKTYTYRTSVWSSGFSDKAVKAYIYWFQSDGTTPASTAFSQSTNDVYFQFGTKMEQYVTAVAPANAAYASFGIAINGANDIGEIFEAEQFGFWIGDDREFLLPSAASEYYQSGLICRVKSDALGISTDFNFSAVQNDYTKINITASTVNLLGGTSTLTYDEYGNKFPSYEEDPGYKKTTYTQLSGLSPAWFNQQIDRRNFMLVVNLEKLRSSENSDIAALFSDTSTTFNFNDTSPYTYISVCTESALYGNEIIPVGQEFDEVQIVETDAYGGTTGLHVVGNATYTLYPNGTELDIAASGQWYVSIPLTNFATFVEGNPDLDFIIYSDPTQSPQLVNSLKTDVMSYSEFQSFATYELSAGNLKFYDNFERAAITPWTSVGGTWSIQDGVLVGTGTNANTYYMPSDTSNDYVIAGRVRLDDAALGGGIAGRVNESTGTRYSTWLYPSNGGAGNAGNVGLIKYATNWTSYTTLQVTPFEVGLDWHDVQMEFIGSRILVWVDGELMIDYTDGSPLTGSGVATDTYMVGAQNIYIDDIIVAAASIGGDRVPTEYLDVQQYADESLLTYDQMGIDVDTSAPTLGRFAGSAIKTYVTLDSPSRWPDKSYADLKTERASYRGYVDFAASNNSVLDTKWEIFDGFAIRIPKDITLSKYNLGLGVHLSSMSLNTRRPTYRRCDLFGVASGDSPSNQISVGNGNVIVIGDMDDININKSFSTHLPTETLPATYLSRELGFFPHSYSDEGEISAINFSLSKDDKITGISFYMNWRSETFRIPDALSGVDSELIANIKYAEDVASVIEDRLITIGVTTSSSLTPWIGDLVVTPNTNVSIFVDGVAGTTIEAGRWHMIYIDLTANGTVPLSNSAKPVRLQHVNEKAVVNYVVSHSIPVSPSNLYASRFGGTDTTIFGDDFSTALHYGDSSSLSVSDNSEVFYVTEQAVDPVAGGAVADRTVTVYFDDTSYVV